MLRPSHPNLRNWAVCFRQEDNQCGASKVPLLMTVPFGVRRLAAAFPKASLLATGYSFSAASPLAGAKRQHAAALQVSPMRKEVLDAPHQQASRSTSQFYFALREFLSFLG